MTGNHPELRPRPTTPRDPATPEVSSPEAEAEPPPDAPEAPEPPEAPEQREAPAHPPEAPPELPDAPPPSPFARLPTDPGGVVAVGLDLLARAGGELRTASFYVGLLVLGLATPLALLIWRFAIDPALVLPVDVEGAYTATLLLAVAGFIVATVESRAVAMTVLAMQLAGEPTSLTAAVQRSRTVFWRLIGALLLTNIPLYLVQRWLSGWTASVLGGETEASVISGAFLAAVLFAPLTYVVAGVVLGDVRPWTAVRRSVRLFRARKATGVVIALFEFGSQLLTLFGVGIALDLVFRGVEATGLSAGDGAGFAAMVAVVVALLFAGGTLLFTVAAISIAPQVVAFLGLTHAAPGMARIGGEGSTFRWLTRPFVVAVGFGGIAMIAGMLAFD